MEWAAAMIPTVEQRERKFALLVCMSDTCCRYVQQKWAPAGVSRELSQTTDLRSAVIVCPCIRDVLCLCWAEEMRRHHCKYCIELHAALRIAAHRLLCWREHLSRDAQDAQFEGVEQKLMNYAFD